MGVDRVVGKVRLQIGRVEFVMGEDRTHRSRFVDQTECNVDLEATYARYEKDWLRCFMLCLDMLCYVPCFRVLQFCNSVLSL